MVSDDCDDCDLFLRQLRRMDSNVSEVPVRL